MKRKSFMALSFILAFYTVIFLPVQQSQAFVPGTYNQFMNLTSAGSAQVVNAFGGVGGLAALIAKYGPYAGGVITVAMMVFDATSLDEDEVKVQVTVSGTGPDSVVQVGVEPVGLPNGVGCNNYILYDDDHAGCYSTGFGHQTYMVGNWTVDRGAGIYSCGRFVEYYCYSSVPDTRQVESVSVIPAPGAPVEGTAITTAQLQTMDATNVVTGAAPNALLNPSSGPVGIPLTQGTHYTTGTAPDPDPVTTPTVTQPAPGDPLVTPNPITSACTECVRTKMFGSVMTNIMTYASTVPMLSFLNKLVFNPTGTVTYSYNASTTKFGNFNMNLSVWSLDMFIGIFRFVVLGGAFISAYYIIFD